MKFSEIANRLTARVAHLCALAKVGTDDVNSHMLFRCAMPG